MSDSLVDNSGDQSLAHEDQNSWVLDSLVGFLKGPVWNLSIQSFIEQKSVVFDPEYETSEDVEQEYKILYEEYKNLVDRLLSSHMSDLEISAEQFDEACRRADGLLASKFKQILFEQIWAANDFRIFVRFMTQRNIELQLQALEILAQRYGLIYESFIPLGANRDDYLNDELVINEAIKRSLAESVDDEERDQQSEENTIEDKNRESLQVMEQKVRLENERLKEQEKLSQTIQSVLTLEDEEVEEEDSHLERDTKQRQLPKLKEEFIEYKPLEVKQNTETEVEEKNESNERSGEQRVKPITRSTGPEGGSHLSAEEIRKRSEYLRKQRDKLLEIKKQERNKQMTKLEEQELLAKRPKSARALRSVTDHNIVDEESAGDQSLAFRRSLAARLKAEVIEQQKH